MSRVSQSLDRVKVTFDDQLGGNGGLVLVGTLVVRLELERLVDPLVRLTGRVVGAHPGRKVLTLVDAIVDRRFSHRSRRVCVAGAPPGCCRSG